MIDYVILAKTDSEKHFKLTNDLLESLEETVYPRGTPFDGFRVTIVESARGSQFRYPEKYSVVEYDACKYETFNYNYALNQGVADIMGKHNDVEWICILNNDVVCEQDWLIEISKAYAEHPDAMSIAPNVNKRADGVIFGYTLFKHLEGCCFLYRRELTERLGLWDETFDFYYQDDDYLQSLKSKDIKHMRVLSSVVRHLGRQSTDYSLEENLMVTKIAAVRYIQKWSYPVFAEAFNDKIMFVRHGV